VPAAVEAFYETLVANVHMWAPAITAMKKMIPATDTEASFDYEALRTKLPEEAKKLGEMFVAQDWGTLRGFTFITPHYKLSPIEF